MSAFSLFKKTVLITGASRGLGRGLTQYLWSKGVNLVLVSKNAEALRAVSNELPAKNNQKVEIFPCDLSSENSLYELIVNLQNYQFDSIINNAAAQTPIGYLHEIDWRDWKATVQLNFLSPVYICRALIPNMLVHEIGGSIINISGGGVSAPRPHFSAYAAAKSGLVGFTATLAEELKDKKIRVNAIAPGPMPTDMLKEVLKSGVHNAGENEILKAEKVLSETSDSFIRVGKLCEFLISEKSSKITGKIISAIWDKWEDFDKLPEDVLNSDIYTMRRIVEADRSDYLRGFGVVHS